VTDPADANDKVNADDSMSVSNRRLVVLGLFPQVLVAVAFAEAIPSLRDELLHNHGTYATWALFIIFATTAVRFAVGNHAHLADDSLFRDGARSAWLYDLVWVVIESILLIILGGQVGDGSLVSSLGHSRVPQDSFVVFLGILLLTDIFWICSVWILGTLNQQWHRDRWPWPWVVLNLIVLGVVAALWHPLVTKGNYSGYYLNVLLVVSIVIFVLDLFLVDWAHIKQ